MASEPSADYPTQWDVVRQAAAGDADALGQLYTRYQPLLRASLLSRFKFPIEKVEEWLHDFFVDKMVKGRLLAKADPVKGRLRDFLRKSVRNYVHDRIRGEPDMVSLDDSELEKLTAEPTAEEETDERDKAVIAETLQRVRDYYETKGKRAFWEVFWDRDVAPILYGVKPISYEALITKWDFKSPQQVYNALNDAKRQFRRFREQVLQEYEE